MPTITEFESIIERITPYLTSRVNVRINGDQIVGEDGSYVDISDGAVRYGPLAIEALDLGTGTTYSHIVNEKATHHIENDSSLHRAIASVINFNILVKHNMSASGMLVRDPIKLLDLSKIYDPDINTDSYVATLSDTINDLCLNTLYAEPHPSDLLDIDIGEYEVTELNDVDILQLNIHSGLFVMIIGNEMEVSLLDREERKVELFKATITEYHEITGSIRNLAMNTENSVGKMLIEILDHMGLLDLYLQAPTTSSLSIVDFFYGIDISFYGNSEELEGEYTYIVTRNALCIGVYKDNVFHSKAVIGDHCPNPEQYKTIRYLHTPMLNRYTNLARSTIGLSIPPYMFTPVVADIPT